MAEYSLPLGDEPYIAPILKEMEEFTHLMA